MHSSVPAMMIEWSGTYPPPRLLSATCTVGLFDVSAMIGQKKSFHEAMKVSIASTAIAGRAIGSTMDRKIRNDYAQPAAG